MYITKKMCEYKYKPNLVEYWLLNNNDEKFKINTTNTHNNIQKKYNKINTNTPSKIKLNK